MKPPLPYPPKPKTRSGVPLSTFVLLFFMVMIGILIGGSAVLLSAPTLFNLSSTQAYFQTQRALLDEQAQALAATGVELQALAGQNNNLATQQANNAQATNVALANSAALLAQTATQSQLNGYATTTANAALTSRQLTQVSLDYQATQVQLNNNATQVQLNYQATLAKLDQTPQANAAQNVLILPRDTAAPTLTSLSNLALVAATVAPTSTITPTHLPFDSSATPAPQATALIDTFAGGIDGNRWVSSGSRDWSVESGDLKTTVPNAWLLSRSDVLGDMTLSITLTPALLSQANYDVVFNVANGEGYFVRFTAVNLKVTRVAVYRFDGGLPIRGVGNNYVDLSANSNLSGDSVLELQVRSGNLSASIDGVEVLPQTAINIAGGGAFGLQLPQGTLLASVSVR